MTIRKRLSDAEERARLIGVSGAEPEPVPDDAEARALHADFVDAVAGLGLDGMGRRRRAGAILASPAATTAGNRYARRLAQLRDADRPNRYV